MIPDQAARLELDGLRRSVANGLGRLQEKKAWLSVFYGGDDQVPIGFQRWLAARASNYEAIEQHLEDVSIIDPRYMRDVEALREQIESDSVDRARRREAELELAEYIHDVAIQNPVAGEYYGLPDLAESMRHCRQSGTIGLKPDGKYVVAWDHKCEQIRLCPDEARDETRRVMERYVPPMLEWLRENRRHRLYWAVLTDQNIPAGRLADGKTRLIADFITHIWRGKYRACPLERQGGSYLPNRCRTMAKFPQLKGALLVQEDPLAADGNWNVHLNVLLLANDRLDFGELRREWGRNLEIRELRDHNSNALRDTIAELVKYAALAVPSKSAEKRATGVTRAPAMIEWPTERWLEWWAAQQRFRRTRSYGVLHGIPKPPTRSLEDIRWIGTIEYVGGYYEASIVPPAPEQGSLDLIPGDNFLASPSPQGLDPPSGGYPPGYGLPWCAH